MTWVYKSQGRGGASGQISERGREDPGPAHNAGLSPNAPSTMSITLYGIPNCETVKKARAAVEQKGLAYTFHDFKKQGVPEQRLDAWIAALGWEALVNRKGTTWRKLDEASRAGIVDAASAKALMLAQASVIKRPVVEQGGRVLGAGLDAVVGL
jgi:Spx/MgsR family transcriptional regulator